MNYQGLLSFDCWYGVSCFISDFVWSLMIFLKIESQKKTRAYLVCKIVWHSSLLCLCALNSFLKSLRICRCFLSRDCEHSSSIYFSPHLLYWVCAYIHIMHARERMRDFKGFSDDYYDIRFQSVISLLLFVVSLWWVIYVFSVVFMVLHWVCVLSAIFIWLCIARFFSTTFFIRYNPT